MHTATAVLLKQILYSQALSSETTLDQVLMSTNEPQNCYCTHAAVHPRRVLPCTNTLHLHPHCRSNLQAHKQSLRKIRGKSSPHLHHMEIKPWWRLLVFTYK